MYGSGNKKMEEKYAHFKSYENNIQMNVRGKEK